LHVLNDDPQQDFRVTAFITTLVMNYLFTGKFKAHEVASRPAMSNSVETSQLLAL
jgi:hypothetical protein